MDTPNSNICKSPVILIVEDEPILNQAMECVFEDLDIESTAVTHGIDGLDHLKSQKFDICIVDMRLPDMTGNQFITKAKKLNPELEFIIYTGSIDYSIPKDLRDMGIKRNQVFIKPVKDLNEIVDAVNRLYEKNTDHR